MKMSEILEDLQSNKKFFSDMSKNRDIISDVKIMKAQRRSRGEIILYIKHKYGEKYMELAAKTYDTTHRHKMMEEVWSRPDSIEKIKKLKAIMSKPLPAKDSKILLKDVLSSKELFDIIDSEYNNNDIRDIVSQYISMNYPELYSELSGNNTSKEKADTDFSSFSLLGNHIV